MGVTRQAEASGAWQRLPSQAYDAAASVTRLEDFEDDAAEGAVDVDEAEAMIAARTHGDGRKKRQKRDKRDAQMTAAQAESPRPAWKLHVEAPAEP